MNSNQLTTLLVFQENDNIIFLSSDLASIVENIFENTDGSEIFPGMKIKFNEVFFVVDNITAYKDSNGNTKYLDAAVGEHHDYNFVMRINLKRI